jgi:misacylated tRNA(Ala) deacylase
MRSHTAAHILSAVFNHEAGAMITGNQLDYDESRVDFSLKDFDKEKVRSYFDLANAIIRKDLPVKVSYMARHDVEKDPNMCKLAKGLPESLKELRIVSIGDFDSQADGGTHVRNTMEIGEIVLTDTKNKGAENRRVYFQLVN